MTPELYFAFVAAAAILMLIPGPNVALIAGISVARGLRHGLATVAGTSTAMVVQLALVGAGLNAMLLGLADWFEILRWIGAAYLVYLGIAMWRAGAAAADEQTSPRRAYRNIYIRGLLVSLTNPKTLFFYGAFFPQFIAADSDPTVQILVLSATFLAIAIVIDSGWAVAAAKLHAARFAETKNGNRLGGSLLIGAGLGLALARKS
jgi:threonine/homoserine/homoserine lactone efflux protein